MGSDLWDGLRAQGGAGKGSVVGMEQNTAQQTNKKIQRKFNRDLGRNQIYCLFLRCLPVFYVALTVCVSLLDNSNCSSNSYEG